MMSNGGNSKAAHPMAALGVSQLGDAAHRVWLTLAARSFARDLFWCEVSMGELGRLIDRSTDVVDMAIKKLVESGHIEILDQGGPGRARRYKLNLMRLEA